MRNVRFACAVFAMASLVHDLHDLAQLVTKKTVVLRTRLFTSLIMDTLFMVTIVIKVIIIFKFSSGHAKRLIICK